MDRRAVLAVSVVIGFLILLGCGDQLGETTTPTPSATRTSPLPTTPALAPTDTATPTTTSEPSPTPEATHTPPPITSAAPTSPPPRVTAEVVRIIDGDTVEIEVDDRVYKVRYIGIDTPEQGEPFFAEATEANRQLVGGKTVVVERDVSETDRYGRLLLYVYLQDGTFVNAELVRQGYAQAATFPPDVRYAELFVQLQAEAREAGRGLWGQPRFVATSTSAPVPTNTPVPGQAKVIIKSIYYDGQVYRVESDEYAEISNTGNAPINIGGWRLNAGDPGQDFTFPIFDLQPGQACRVYTNEVHPESCGFSFGIGRAIWNNKGDCGYLYDASGAEVDDYCY